MIGHWWVETLKTNKQDTVDKAIFPYEDYGLYLVEYDAAPPKLRKYRATIEGRDGTLDLTEWEGPGIVRYDDRTVTVKTREIDGRGLSNRFVGAVLGRRLRLHFDDDPDYYYIGRCEEAQTSTRNHVTDTDLTFTCNPYRKAIAPTSQSFTVEAGEGGTYANETVYISSGQVLPTFSASGVETGEQTPVVLNDVVYTRTEHRTASLYSLWTNYTGGKSKGSAYYGKPKNADDNCTGVVMFDGLDLTGKTVKSIDLTISAARVGFGQWKEKTVNVYGSADGVTFSETMKGRDYAGTQLGTLTGVFFESTSQYSITGTLLDNIAAYFAAGGNTLVLYDPTARAAYADYSEFNCAWTDVQMDIVYEETEPTPEVKYSTLEVESDGVRRVYPITEDGPIYTDDVIFRAGDNLITINNHNATRALTVTVSWSAEVI